MPKSAFDDTRGPLNSAETGNADSDPELRAVLQRHQGATGELDMRQQQVRHTNSRYDHPRTQSALHAHQVHEQQTLMDQHDQELASIKAQQSRERQWSDELKRRHERERRELEQRQRHEAASNR